MALFKRINSTNLSSSDRSIWLLLVVTAFSIPLSLKLYSTERDLEVIFPAELLVGLTALYVIIRWVVSQRARSALDMQALKHPIVILIALDLMISVVSYWGSDEPMVSLKWLVVRTSYVLVFFLVPLLIREFNKEKLVKLLTYHAWALILVVIWVFKAAFEQGFDRNVANYSCMPFYNDHTIYAAALVFALFTFLISALPMPGSTRSISVFTFLISVFSRKEEGASLFGGAVTVVLVSVVVIALVLSYTRAAWLSVVVVVILGVVLLIRPRPAVWLGCTLIIMLVAIFSWRPLRTRTTLGSPKCFGRTLTYQLMPAIGNV